MNLIDCKGDLRMACYKSRRKTISYFGEEKQREPAVGKAGVEPLQGWVCAPGWEGTGEAPIIVIFTVIILCVLCALLCTSLFVPMPVQDVLFQKSINNIKSENKSKLSKTEDLLCYYAHNPCKD